jgi:hypothetical protein
MAITPSRITPQEFSRMVSVWSRILQQERIHKGYSMLRKERTVGPIECMQVLYSTMHTKLWHEPVLQ